MCGVNMPVRVAQQYRGVCPACGEELAGNPNEGPDPDWKEQLERKKEQMAAFEEDAVLIGPPELGHLDIYEEHGLLWVSNFDFWPRLGYRPGTFFRFKVNGQEYEIQGWHESGRRWWVEGVTDAVDAGSE